MSYISDAFVCLLVKQISILYSYPNTNYHDLKKDIIIAKISELFNRLKNLAYATAYGVIWIRF